MRAWDPREPAPFALAVLLGFVVARFVGVAAHEFLGHGLFALAFGGSFYGAYVSPGSGFAFVFLPLGTPDVLDASLSLAGIFVELLFGVGVLFAYPRVRTFLGRLFALLLLEVLLVYSSVYLALGAIDATAGDAAHAAATLEAPHLVASFVVVGLLWAVAAAYWISLEVVRLTAPFASARRQFLYLGLFWFAPIAAVLPSLGFAVTVSAALLLYFALFLSVGGAVFVLSAYLASRLGPPPVAEERRPGRWAVLGIAFALVLVAWLGPFGPTEGTAHGVLFAEPPLEAEATFVGQTAVDVRVTLTRDLAVVLEFRFKGIPEFRRPLEARAWATFEDRAYFPYWVEFAQGLAAQITNVTRVAWNATDAQVDGSGTVWVQGEELANPRVVVLEANATYRPLFTNETDAGGRTFVTLAVFDPYRSGRVPCEGCFVDEFVVAWPGALGAPAYTLVNRTATGGRAEPLVTYDDAEDAYAARYRNLASEDAHAVYTVILERL